MLFRSKKRIAKEEKEHREFAEFRASATRITAPGEIDFNDYKNDLSKRLGTYVPQQTDPQMLIEYLSAIIYEIRDYANEYDW